MNGSIGKTMVNNFRWLYAPVIEPGGIHDLQARTKHGLRDALAATGAMLEFDYLANDRATLYQGFINRLDSFQPTHVLTQFHASDVLSPEQIRELKRLHPGVVWINWSGDSHNHSLIAPGMLELAKEYDLWLCAAPDVLPIYEQHGIRADFWQISFEEPVDPLPDVPEYDVVFLGNVISDKRRALIEFLRTLDGVKVGIYGDHPASDGRCVYDFAMQRALYRKAKIALADCAYPDQANYVSDRPLQIMASGGALLLHQYVPKMGKLIAGVEYGEHYIQWEDFGELRMLIEDWTLDSLLKRSVVDRAREFVYREHTYTRRVEQLIAMLDSIKGDAK